MAWANINDLGGFSLSKLLDTTLASGEHMVNQGDTNTLYTSGETVDNKTFPFTVFDNGILKIEMTNSVSVNAYYNGVGCGSIGGGTTYYSECSIGILIDEDLEACVLFTTHKYDRGSNHKYVAMINSPKGYSEATHNLYLGVKSIVSYVWTSVPAISGKNGILSLTTLKEESINDGSPVDDATASAFNNAPNSCSVGGIVSKDLPIIDNNKTSVALKYNIPPLTDSTYTSVKLVAKKNKIPKSKTDGNRIIDISPSSESVTVSNLEELTKYYFVIFVEDSVGNKAESEPAGPITTGEIPAPFRETVEVLKKTGDDEFTSVYEWTGKWGKPDDASTTHFTVEAQEALDITESATETHFTVEHNETNFISENTETEIVLT